MSRNLRLTYDPNARCYFIYDNGHLDCACLTKWGGLFKLWCMSRPTPPRRAEILIKEVLVK